MKTDLVEGVWLSLAPEINQIEDASRATPATEQIVLRSTLAKIKTANRQTSIRFVVPAWSGCSTYLG